MWHTFENWNYYIDDSPTIYWNDARTACQDIGGDLAVIQSDRQNKFIWSEIIKHNRQQEFGAWIGIFTKMSEGKRELHWVDQTPVQGRFTAWKTGQPGLTEVGKCGSIKNEQWTNLPCNAESDVSKAPVILCQRPIRSKLWLNSIKLFYLPFYFFMCLLVYSVIYLYFITSLPPRRLAASVLQSKNMSLQQAILEEETPPETRTTLPPPPPPHMTSFPPPLQN